MRGASKSHPSNPGLTRHDIIPATNPRVTPNTPVPEPPPRSSKRDDYSRVTVLVDEADVLFDPDFQESTRMLLGDITAARGSPVPTRGNKNADIERRIRRVWAKDALVHSKTATGFGPIKLSKLLVFCNKSSKVEQLAAFLDGCGIKRVALTGGVEMQKRGSNHHLDGSLGPVQTGPGVCHPAQTPHVLVTTSLLSRGLYFSPMIKHVFIVDEPRNLIDFLHRAGCAGRAGQVGKVVVFGRAKGSGSGRMEEVKEKVKACWIDGGVTVKLLITFVIKLCLIDNATSLDINLTSSLTLFLTINHSYRSSSCVQALNSIHALLKVSLHSYDPPDVRQTAPMGAIEV
ncbi:uncharacterized protein F5891DRAFT_1227728 [Suillus fuscotomentosus]|uniref:RNA helicase n=1 Tax=Suillus fuscotomentosus TaxID=1912939 RepID=A0AAD4E5I6_9AGAM|nr:uncharacterized protein F5891DRAFT_1227728 [Suillus fuscotomentosus]KAG1900128.1 hypothetical protein F5891DRAFT_1227728 [Suillus fuscotomentosus]